MNGVEPYDDLEYAWEKLDRARSSWDRQLDEAKALLADIESGNMDVCNDLIDLVEDWPDEYERLMAAEENYQFYLQKRGKDTVAESETPDEKVTGP